MTRKPKVAFAILADSHKAGAGGKLDAQGIFDTLFVWGTPATRECSLIFSLSNIPSGTTELTFWLRGPSKKSKVIGKAKLSASASSHSLIIGERLRFSLSEVGAFQVGVALAGDTERSIRWLPMLVQLQPWVELPTGSELAALLAESQAIKALRAELRCGKCASRYQFELQVDQSRPLTKGALPFPKDGKFKCPKCRTIHHLRDVEGRLRSHIGRTASSEPR